MLGLWAATSRLNWSVRLLTVVLLLSLLMWRPLYEPYLTLLSEVGVVVLGVAIWRRSSWRPNFSIGGLLKITTIAAIIVASLARQPDPEIGVTAIAKVTLLGAVAGLCTLGGAWLVASPAQWRLKVAVFGAVTMLLTAAWWGVNYYGEVIDEYLDPWANALLGVTPSPLISWGKALAGVVALTLVAAVLTLLGRRRLAIGSIVALLICAVPTYFAIRLSFPLPKPAGPVAASPAYLEMLGIGNEPTMSAVDNEWGNDPTKWKLLATKVIAAKEEFAKSETIVQQPLTMPLSYDDLLMEDYGPLRSLARCWDGKCQLAVRRGDKDDAYRSLIWLWDYSSQLEGQGILVNALLHSAIEGVAAEAAYKSLPSLSRDQKLAMASRLAAYNADRSDWNATLYRERVFSEHYSG